MSCRSVNRAQEIHNNVDGQPGPQRRCRDLILLFEGNLDRRVYPDAQPTRLTNFRSARSKLTRPSAAGNSAEALVFNRRQRDEGAQIGVVLVVVHPPNVLPVPNTMLRISSSPR